MKEPRTPIADAYMHVGLPRFGSASEALGVCDRWGIARAVLVLGPFVPDIKALHEAQSRRPDSIRTIGIPYGETEEKRLRCAEACFAAGAIGFRLQGNEPLENPGMMRELGQRSGWAYATDPLRSARHTEFYLQWLEDHPAARIGAPHFLSPDTSRLETAGAAQLLAHERFFPIFSRHGQTGTRESYPHKDLLPWVQHVVSACGWNRILWGSEYPVLLWRNEQVGQARQWIRDLGISVSDEEYLAFCSGNADRLFFSGPAPSSSMPELPDWLAEFEVDWPVPLSATGTVTLPLDVYQPLISDFLKTNGPENQTSFTDYCVEQLRIRARELSH